MNSTSSVHRSRQGDEGDPRDCESPLVALFIDQESPLLRYAFSLTGRRAVAEEIVQDVFLKLHRDGGIVQEPKAWLFRCVRNQCFDHVRRQKREVPLADDSTSHANSSAKIGECQNDHETGHLMMQMEATGALRLICEELEPCDQRLVKMKYFEGLKYREISERTGLSIGNVGNRLHYILKRMAVRLRSLGIDETL